MWVVGVVVPLKLVVEELCAAEFLSQQLLAVPRLHERRVGMFAVVGGIRVFTPEG